MKSAWPVVAVVMMAFALAGWCLVAPEAESGPGLRAELRGPRMPAIPPPPPAAPTLAPIASVPFIAPPSEAGVALVPVVNSPASPESGLAAAPVEFALDALVRDARGETVAGLPVLVVGSPELAQREVRWTGATDAAGRVRASIAAPAAGQVLALEAGLPIAIERRPRVVVPWEALLARGAAGAGRARKPSADAVAGNSASAEADTEIAPIELEVPELGTVTVRLIDADGRPPEDAGTLRLVAVARPDEEAAYDLAGLPMPIHEGQGSLHHVPVGFRVRVRAEFPLREPSIAEFAGPVRFDLPVQHDVRVNPLCAALWATLTKGGEPLPLASGLSALLDGTGQVVWSRSFVADAEGTWTLRLPHDLERHRVQGLRILASLEGKPWTREWSAFAMPSQPGWHDLGTVELERFGGRIRGVVIGPGGEPIAGARVVIQEQEVVPELAAQRRERRILRMNTPLRSQETITDASGRFGVGGPEPMPAWVLSANAHGYLHAQVEGKGDDGSVVLQLPKTRPSAIIALLDPTAPEAGLRGYVCKEDGKHYAGGLINTREGQRRLIERTAEATKVRFEVPHLETFPAVWLLLTADGAVVAEQGAVLVGPDGEVPVVDLRGRLRAVTLTVLDPKGLPASQAYVDALRPDGRRGPFSFTDHGGRVHLLLSEPSTFFGISRDGASSEIVSVSGDLTVQLRPEHSILLDLPSALADVPVTELLLHVGSLSVPGAMPAPAVHGNRRLEAAGPGVARVQMPGPGRYALRLSRANPENKARGVGPFVQLEVDIDGSEGQRLRLPEPR